MTVFVGTVRQPAFITPLYGPAIQPGNSARADITFLNRVEHVSVCYLESPPPPSLPLSLSLLFSWLSLMFVNELLFFK